MGCKADNVVGWTGIAHRAADGLKSASGRATTRRGVWQRTKAFAVLGGLEMKLPAPQCGEVVTGKVRAGS